MATAITESNLMVDDSDELSSKIFTAFPSFQESNSLLTPSPLKEDLCRAVTLVIIRKQMLYNLSGDRRLPLITAIFTIITTDTCAGAACVRVHV